LVQKRVRTSDVKTIEAKREIFEEKKKKLFRLDRSISVRNWNILHIISGIVMNAAPTVSSLVSNARRRRSRTAWKRGPTVSSLVMSAERESKVEVDRMRRRRSKSVGHRMTAPTVSSLISSVLNERKTNIEESRFEENEMERIHSKIMSKVRVIKHDNKNQTSEDPIDYIMNDGDDDLIKQISELNDAKRGIITPSCEVEEEEEEKEEEESPLLKPKVIQRRRRVRTISEEEEREEEKRRNKRRDQEVERLRQEHLARKQKVQEEQRIRREKMNATIEHNRKQKAAREKRPTTSEYTRGGVDDLVDSFVEQWTQCAQQDWEVPLSFEKEGEYAERSAKIRLSYSERLRFAREKLRKMAQHNNCYEKEGKKKKKETRRRSRSFSPRRQRSSLLPDNDEKDSKEAERICKLVETRVNRWARNKSFLELISTVHSLLPRHCPDFSNESKCNDSKELRRRYREILRRVHPDKIGKREGDVSPTVEELLIAQHAVSVLLNAKPERRRT